MQLIPYGHWDCVSNPDQLIDWSNHLLRNWHSLCDGVLYSAMPVLIEITHVWVSHAVRCLGLQ